MFTQSYVHSFTPNIYIHTHRVIIGVIVGIPLIIIIIICCCPKIRHKVVIATKNCCGVELDPDEQLIYERSKARKALRRQRRVGIASSNTTRQLAAIDTRAMAAFKIKVNRAFQKRARCETRLLFYINLFWSIVGFFCLLLGLCAASGFPAGMQNTAPLLIVSAIFITAISSCGCSNINTGRPSLKLLVYFYIALFSGVGCLLMGVAMLFFSDYSDDTLESNWFSLRLYFPESYQDLTLEEAQDQFEDDFGFDWNYTLYVFFFLSLSLSSTYTHTHNTICRYGGYGILSFSTTVGALSAAYVLTWNNLMQNIFLIFNALFILSFGIVMLTLGVSLLDIDLLEKLQTVMIILVGLLYLVSFASGIIGDWFKNDKCLKVYQIFALVSAISGYTFSILIYTSESTIRDNVNALDDEDKAIAAETLSLESTTSEELADLIVGTFKLYGLISIIDSTILLVLALLSRYIIRFHEARTKKLSDWAKRCARAEELGLSRPIAPDVSFLGLVRHISQRDALGSQLNNNNPIIQNRSDIELAHDHAIPVVQARDVDQLPQACAIELADLPDGMEFPGPPPDVPQGQDSPHNLLAEVAVPVYRPEPVPPVRSQPVLEEKEEEEEEEEEEKQGDDCVDIESI